MTKIIAPKERPGHIIPEEFSRLLACLDKYTYQEYQIRVTELKLAPSGIEQSTGWQSYHARYALSMSGIPLCTTENFPHTEDGDKIGEVLSNHLRSYVRDVPQERLRINDVGNHGVVVDPRDHPDVWNNRRYFQRWEAAHALGSVPAVLPKDINKPFELDEILRFAIIRRLPSAYVLAKLDGLAHFQPT